LGDVSKVAAEGDTLEDGTVLEAINYDGGVAINLWGVLAFHGEVDDPDDPGPLIDAVFVGLAP
jgi:hypothetical protein